MISANGEPISGDEFEWAESFVEAVEIEQPGIFSATFENVRIVGGIASLVNVVSVLAQSVVDLRRELAAQRPEAQVPVIGDGVVLRVRDVDVQRLTALVMLMGDRSPLSDAETTELFGVVFDTALDDPYGPAGRRWAMRSLLNLSVALLAREMTVRAARDEIDALEALQAALDEIHLGEV